MGMLRYCFGLTLLLATLPSSALALPAPTSGDPSAISGRTLGNHQVLLAAGVGWPGFWAEALFSPSRTLDVGVRGDVLYGSPLLGFGTGVGGEVSVPLRLHLWAGEKSDFSLAGRPFLDLGDGSLVGEQGIFAGSFGYALGLEIEGLLGVQVSGGVTLTVGAGSNLAFTNVPENSASGDLIGSLYGVVGVEAIFSGTTLLFARIRGGYGFAPDRLFDSRANLRVSFGVAYQL
ncbi:MAG: hypothetical protein GXP55_18575 [Deltaproteobacteria bacterium]|nr:hypothetical protein [Deltaproteobacteria bacterium]